MKYLRSFLVIAMIVSVIAGLYPARTVHAETAEYIILEGGIYSVDDGCPSWGTTDYSKIRAIGDTVGNIEITYGDGTKSVIPLIFGYTVWFRSMWNSQGLPFKGSGADAGMSELLKKTLCLWGGYEGSDAYYLRIKPENKPISNVRITDSKEKEGSPIFNEIIYINGTKELRKGDVTVSSDDRFFESHTIDASAPLPESVSEALIKLRDAASTGINECESAVPYVFPGNAKKTVVFSGDSLADIATGVYYENLMNLYERFDEDGMLHTSYKNAPSWWYNGFGAYTDNVGSYYDAFYSRDGGRAIMTANAAGYTAETLRSVEYGGKCMMYFPENGLTIKGEKIPGHYTVIINKPLIYSTYLVPEAHWASKYTKEKFGEGYQNLGNQETDGHGLMMLATYNVWKNSGEDRAWAEKNWDFINEGVKWIEWCLEHTELSFSRKGLLYAESEAGMCSYTLYCNVPCYLGMLGYAEIADSIGKSDTAASWRSTASELKKAIENGLMSETSGTAEWKQSVYGFYFCPVVNMLSDYYGYDTDSMDAGWVRAAEASYKNDIVSVRNAGYFGATGIGYSHSMITQASLLLDEMADASELLKNLCRISYAPGQPEPYLIPEGITVDLTNGTLRRQGDLGNLVQLAEGLKSFTIAVGVNPAADGCLKIMPRLPEEWNVTLTDYSVRNSSGATVSMYAEYPSDGAQRAIISLSNAQNITNGVKYRFGPFDYSSSVSAAQINGINVPSSIVYSGDSAWVWVDVPNEYIKDSECKMAVITASSVDKLGEFPSFDGITVPKESKADKGISSAAIVIVIIMAIIIIAVLSLIIIKRKRRR